MTTMNIPDNNHPRVVIIGGGFGGVALAKKLRKLPFQVVLVDRNNHHTFQPLLYQVATGGLEPESVGFPFRKLFSGARNVYFRWAEVERIDTQHKRLHTNRGDLPYDHLVVATGTRTNFFGKRDIKQHAMSMKSLWEAVDIRTLALQNLEQANALSDPEQRRELMNVSIIGGGPTGVELAGAFAELRRNVFPKDYPHLPLSTMEIHLFEGMDKLLGGMSQESSERAKRGLEKLGVEVHLGSLADSYDGTTLVTTDGMRIRSKNVLWTAGVTGALLDGFPEAAVHEKTRRLHVDPYCRVRGLEAVYAIGDIALMETEVYPKGHPQVAQPAIQQGRLLGDNFRRLVQGEALRPFHYKDLGSMATIGRNRAVADLPHFSFGGVMAWYAWLGVHLRALMGFRNRAIVALNWAYNYFTYDSAVRMVIGPLSDAPQPPAEGVERRKADPVTPQRILRAAGDR